MKEQLSYESGWVNHLGLVLKRGTWTNFRWDFSAAVFFSVFNAVFGQFYIPMALRNGATNLEVGLLSAAPAIGLLFSPLWANALSGRELKSFVVYPNLLARASLVAVAVYPKPWMFVGVSLLVNFLGGIQAPAYAAFVTRMYPHLLRGRLMGYVRVALGMALVPVTYGVGLWFARSGSSGPLTAAAVTGVISILLFANAQEVEATAHTSTPRLGVSQQWEMVRSNRPLAIFLVATTLSGFGNMLASPLYQIFQIHQLNLTDSQISLTRMVYYGFLLVAYFVIGWVIDHLSPKVAMLGGIAAYIVVPLLYAVGGTYGAVMVASGFQGMGDAAWDIGAMTYIFKSSPGREASAFGMHLMLFGVRGSIGPMLGTALSHSLSPVWIWYSAAAFGLMGYVVLFDPHHRGRGISTMSWLRRAGLGIPPH